MLKWTDLRRGDRVRIIELNVERPDRGIVVGAVATVTLISQVSFDVVARGFEHFDWREGLSLDMVRKLSPLELLALEAE